MMTIPSIRIFFLIVFKHQGEGMLDLAVSKIVDGVCECEIRRRGITNSD